ncbi:tRNA (adenosine(37)-N6)-dimethylallyltransferase MiaA [Geothermobacter hydrogeniphilus]|uniref:tRNA dimethylallyltransferase n=1 Tax=Geothermobacter hydrogeniphilus TaxID=1969733 RepID=A0A2K2HCF3_9BACT|nr:tRNA (adenosine(37)-N6)-dimethylallyltransferase MiaA [Geothermobacter hydrogeniphilus]PNU20957.1 tRNA (adenosine(37)-N6)-dimethylallyltransferase MiaA [Geothermobacter hydrogeniphilus]
MANEPKQPLLVICGPTASGKTGLALSLAGQFPVEIISADSRQVYRRLDIGTAKPTAAELSRVRHHLIDLVEPEQPFSVADFVDLANAAIADIAARGQWPLLVGGTGLYIQALTAGLAETPSADPRLRATLEAEAREHGLDRLYRRLQQVDPPTAARLSPNDQVRIVRALEVEALSGRRMSDFQARHAFAEHPFRLLKLGLLQQREHLYRRIEQRVDAMFAAGLVDEVRALLASGCPADVKGLKTIGYQEVMTYLRGDCDLPTAIELVKRNSRRYAKRQMTWFRRDSSIIWVDPEREFVRITELIAEFNAA